MVDDLVGDGDGVAGRGVTGRDEERTSPEQETAWLVVASSAEVRKGT
jgi:hypothetical protein